MTVLRTGHSSAASRVLLVGNKWDSLSATLKSLAGKGGITFVGPSERGSPDILSLVDPAVIMVGPGCDSASVLAQESAPGEAAELPPVLVCLTLDDLETGEYSSTQVEFDDFLVVPCSSAELEWRLWRLARRNGGSASGECLEVGRIALYPDTYQVRLAGRPVPMAWMEFQLLKYLMENVGRVFTRNALLSSVWGFDSFGGTRTVDVHIRKLRSKLEIHGEKYFRTVKNVGYGMINPT